MPESRQIARRDEPNYLTSKPQALGILPTWWFWNDKENWKLASGLISVWVVFALYTILMLDLGTLGAGLAGGLAPILGMGLLERYIRWRVKKRSALPHAQLSEEQSE